LRAKQRGLDAAGVAMPSFGNIGKQLAKEINEEPEETEDDSEYASNIGFMRMEGTVG